MRIFIAIWSLFLTCLAVMPCGDAVAADNCGEQLHWHDASSHQHNATEGMDFCSPLCSCHCCHMHLIKGEVSNSIITPLYSKPVSEALNGSYSADHNALWHPPKS